MLIEDWRKAWKMLSVQVQAIWAAICAVYLAMPAEQQGQLLQLLGLPAGAAVGVSFAAQVAIGVSAATVAARMTSQPALRQ